MSPAQHHSNHDHGTPLIARRRRCIQSIKKRLVAYRLEQRARLQRRPPVYLNEVVEAGPIRGAAERAGIAASSINRQIIALEQELGAPIFERMPR
jgi:molybdenum-dependent DNA-binding transcriptional regulator ModE